MGIVLEEADESQFWLEVVEERKMLRSEAARPLLIEAGELVAIMVSSIQTARGRR
jgi:four helix bundle protein